MKTILTLLLLSITLSLKLSAQLRFNVIEYPAKIVTTDGKSIEGYAQLPNSPFAKHVKWRDKGSRKSIKFPGAMIENITLYDANYEVAHYLVRSKYLYYKYLSKKKAKRVLDSISPQLAKEEVFLYQIAGDKSLSVFAYYETYKVKSDESIILINKGYDIPPDSYYFFLRDTEEHPTLVIRDPNTTFSRNKYFKMFGPKYFQDCAFLSTEIMEGNVTYKDIDVILAIYRNECTE